MVESKTKKDKTTVLRWVYLALSTLITSFIIFQACLTGDVSARWSGAFVKFFSHLFNSSNVDTSKYVPVSGIDIDLLSTYSYNNIEGYQDNELPLGTTKLLESKVKPNDATNKAISYRVEDESILSFHQEVNGLYITGKSIGSTKVYVFSEDNKEINNSFLVTVSDRIAPINYDVYDIEVYKNSLFKLPITISSTVNENDIEKYYDINKLQITYSDFYLAPSMDFENYYIAKNIGESSINIKKDATFKTFNLLIKDDSSLTKHQFDSIRGQDVLFESSNSVYEAYLDDNTLTKDVVWDVDNKDIAKVDSFGRLSINKVEEETKIKLTAISTIDPSIIITKEIKLKPITVTSFELVIPYYGTHITNMPYMGNVGQQLKVWMEDNTGTIAKSGVIATSSNEEAAKVYVQGSYLYISCLKEGDAIISVTSINNPNVTKIIDLTVTTRGVINNENYLSFSEFIRKSIGHFSLFMVDGMFIYLTLYFFLRDKNNVKKWLFALIIVFTGLFLAGLSELIQHFVPSRYGSITDVLVDLVGFVLGAALINVISFFIKRHKVKKQFKKKMENNN